MAALLAGGAGVNEPKTDGSKTALFAAYNGVGRHDPERCGRQRESGQKRRPHAAPVVACEESLTEIVAKLIAANAE